jgi:hypothetical protein
VDLELKSYTGRISGFGRKLEVEFGEAGFLVRGLSKPEADMLCLMISKVSAQWASDPPKEKVEAAPASAPNGSVKDEASPAAPASVPAADPPKRGPGRPRKTEAVAAAVAETAQKVAPAPAPVVEVVDQTARQATSVASDFDDEVPFDVGPPTYSSAADLPAELKAADKLSKIVRWCRDNGAKDADACVQYVKALRPVHELLARNPESEILPRIPRIFAELAAAQ